MVREEASPYLEMKASSSVRYDLVGKIVSETGMTQSGGFNFGIEKSIFDQFGNNPEEFILRAANIINEQKATAIEHITYDKLTSEFSTNIFTEPDLKKGALGVNAIEAKRHLYDYLSSTCALISLTHSRS